MTFIVGHSLRGYEIQKFVQEGGFSSVYRAYQDSIYRHVAIKVIEHDELVKSVNFIRRFEIEAQIIARLEHPHIVPIYDFWREPDRAYIVMRWLDGGSMRNLFYNDDTQRYNVDTLTALITHIGSALQFVHQRDIVHRDIKPDNILIDNAGNFYLTDFGIAIEMEKRDQIEAEFLRIGTPDYMSPEQILYDEFTQKSDIYAFAILIYEVLTNELPFTGKTMESILSQHVNVPFPSILPKRPDLPYQIDGILARATEKSPEARYDNVIEFVQALIPLLNAMKPTTTTIHVSPTAKTQPVETVDFSPKTTPIPDPKTTPLSNPVTTSLLDNIVINVSNPYKGLKAFSEADVHEFYGRDAVIHQMLYLLRQQLQHKQSSFIAVIGASGSGKSSVVRAGLVPQLRQGELNGSENWFYVSMTPGDSPLATFVEKLNSIAIYGDDMLLQLLRDNPEDGISAIGEMVGQEHVFVLIDQFEELFTQIDDEFERKEFIDLLIALCKSNLRATIAITLRADFYDKPLAYRELGELIQTSTVNVLPMSADELEQVIIEPARSVRVDVQASLVSQLIADTISQPNALPLLQFTVTELFENRENDILTLKAYEDMGRLRGSIVQRAETVFLSLSPRGQELAQKLFLQLVILSDTSETVRRRILWRDALLISANHTEIESIINVFGDSRLLTFDNEPLLRQPTIEVAHEALIQAWTRLQIWITENRNALLTHNRLMTSVRDWLENNRDHSFLSRDAQLLQYEELHQTSIIRLTDDEREYVEESQALRRRNQWIRYSVIASLVILTIASVIVSFVAIDRQTQADIARREAVDERDRANQESRISQSRALAATALNLRENGRFALSTAVSANQIDDTFEARDSLANILADHQYVRRYSSIGIGVRDFELMTDSKSAFLVGGSNSILRWDYETSVVDEFIVLDEITVLNSVKLHPNGEQLAVGGQNGLAIIDIASRDILQLVERETEVWSVAWSSDGQIAYGVDASGSVVGVDVAEGELIFDVTIATQTLFDLAIAPDGETIAVGGADNIIYALDALTGEVLYEFTAHDNWVLALAYSPDGRLLASSGADLTIIVWDMLNLQALGQIPTRHTDWIRDIVFSPDGTEMSSVSADQTIKRWDVASGRQLAEVLDRHTVATWTATYLENQRLLSVDREGTLIEWGVSDLSFPMVDVVQLESEISDVLMLDDLNQVVVAVTRNNEIALLLWLDLATGEIVDELTLPSFVTSLDYDESKQLLIVAGIDQTLRLVDLSNPEQFTLLGQHESIISDVALSPDGLHLISVDDNSHLIQWDMETQSKLDEQKLDALSGLSLIQYLDDDRFITGDRTGNMVVWRAESLEPLQTLSNVHDGAVTDVMLVDDLLYSVGRDGLIVVWDMETGSTETGFSQIHTDWILDIEQIDPQTIATLGRDGRLVLWDTDSRQAIGQPLVPSASDWGLFIAVDDLSGRAYTFYRDGEIVTWQLTLDDWLSHACELINFDALFAKKSNGSGEPCTR